MTRLESAEAIGVADPGPRVGESRASVASVANLTQVMNGLVFADLNGRVTLFNPAAEAMAGLGSFTAMSRSLPGLKGTSELMDAVIDDWARAVREGHVTRVVEVHDQAHDLRYFKLDSAVILDRAGKPAGVLVVMDDVTENHKIDQRRNQFLSIVAHELRTPLTGIKTFSTMLAKGRLGPLAARQQEVVESIREQSIRLEQQIDKLVNLGSLEAKEQGQDLAILDLGDEIRAAVAPLVRAAHDKGLEFVLDLPDEHIEVGADRSGLRRAVQAFVENAIKFTRSGGFVRVAVEVDGEQARLVVEDDGIGIDPRYHRRIFEKFFQVEDPLTRHHGGAGLGLFVANGIVEAHGSRTEVTSELGRGAKFAFGLRVHPRNVDNSPS